MYFVSPSSHQNTLLYNNNQFYFPMKHFLTVIDNQDDFLGMKTKTKTSLTISMTIVFSERNDNDKIIKLKNILLVTAGHQHSQQIFNILQ